MEAIQYINAKGTFSRQAGSLNLPTNFTDTVFGKASKERTVSRLLSFSYMQNAYVGISEEVFFNLLADEIIKSFPSKNILDEEKAVAVFTLLTISSIAVDELNQSLAELITEKLILKEKHGEFYYYFPTPELVDKIVH